MSNFINHKDENLFQRRTYSTETRQNEVIRTEKPFSPPGGTVVKKSSQNRTQARRPKLLEKFVFTSSGELPPGIIIKFRVGLSLIVETYTVGTFW